MFSRVCAETLCVQEYIWGDEASVWTEMIRGKDIAGEKIDVAKDAGPTAEELADEKKLGRIKIGMYSARSVLFHCTKPLVRQVLLSFLCRITRLRNVLQAFSMAESSKTVNLVRSTRFTR